MKTTLHHGLYSQNEDRFFIWFEEYNIDEIKKSIIEWLSDINNFDDVIEHCKECSASDLKRFAGHDILGFYGVNPKNGKPSKIITRGDKDYYKSL